MRTLVHITDLHCLPGGLLLYDRLDPLQALEAAMEAIEASQIEPAALVLSGDLADAGQPEAYRRLRGAVEPCAARLGARVVYAAGNHDDRAALRAELLDASGEAPIDAVTWVDDLRIVTLDSSVPGGSSPGPHCARSPGGTCSLLVSRPRRIITPVRLCSASERNCVSDASSQRQTSDPGGAIAGPIIRRRDRGCGLRRPERCAHLDTHAALGQAHRRGQPDHAGPDHHRVRCRLRCHRCIVPRRTHGLNQCRTITSSERGRSFERPRCTPEGGRIAGRSGRRALLRPA